ncbi:hypothetical protein [Paracoccus sp. TOH]|uniref:hypothetical protein n=1 Tax=Paracoccus sp. TOH TaxID=1263728 RepID=UPI0025B13891|nr:hypothetical protein [Paracoccus sp. TOH]WJS84185.1 hypothetical protein NBE95_10500 [Paracoccus sp. TOH]
MIFDRIFRFIASLGLLCASMTSPSLAQTNQKHSIGDRFIWPGGEACLVSESVEMRKEIDRLTRELPLRPSGPAAGAYITAGVMAHFITMNFMRFGDALVTGTKRLFFSTEFAALQEAVTPKTLGPDPLQAFGISPNQKLFFDFFIPPIGAALDAAVWAEDTRTEISHNYRRRLGVIEDIRSILEVKDPTDWIMSDCATGKILSDKMTDTVLDEYQRKILPDGRVIGNIPCQACHVPGRPMFEATNRALDGFMHPPSSWFDGIGFDDDAGGSRKGKSGGGVRDEVSEDCGELGCSTVDSADLEVSPVGSTGN